MVRKLLRVTVALLVAVLSRAEAAERVLYATSIAPSAQNWLYELFAAGDPGCPDSGFDAPGCYCHCGGDTPPCPTNPGRHALEDDPLLAPSSYLVAQDFSPFDLPPGARITSVKVNVLARYDKNSTDATRRIRVQVVGNGLDYDTISDRGVWSRASQGTDGYYCSWRKFGGGDIELMGRSPTWNSPTAADVNSLVVRVKSHDVDEELRVKAFRIEVTYDDPSQCNRNNIVDPGEQCDGGPCCDTNCHVLRAGSSCPDDGNPCTADHCDGGSTLCVHTSGNAGAICRAVTGECDVAETCTGASPMCPADAGKSAGAPCADDGDACTTDTCDGVSKVCRHTVAPGKGCCAASPVSPATYGPTNQTVIPATGRALTLSLSAPQQGSTADATVDVQGTCAVGSDQINVVYIIDASGSTNAGGFDFSGDGVPDANDDFNQDGIGGTVLDGEIAAFDLLTRAIVGRPNVRVGLVAFGSSAVIADLGPEDGEQAFVSPPGRDANQANDVDMMEVLRSMRIGTVGQFTPKSFFDSTEYEAALLETKAALTQAGPGAGIVFFISDGDNKGPAVCDDRGCGPVVADFVDAGVTIHTVGVGDPALFDELELIARATGGTFVRVTNADDLPMVLTTIAATKIKEVRVNGVPVLPGPLGHFDSALRCPAAGEFRIESECVADDAVATTVRADAVVYCCTGGANPAPPTCPGGCDDGNECTADECVAGTCRHEPDGSIPFVYCSLQRAQRLAACVAQADDAKLARMVDRGLLVLADGVQRLSSGTGKEKRRASRRVGVALRRIAVRAKRADRRGAVPVGCGVQLLQALEDVRRVLQPTLRQQ